MPLNKKIMISLFTIIFIVSSFSGCIIEDLLFGTSFTLGTWDIVDEEGFPGLSLDFTCNGRVNLKLYDSKSSLLDYDFFYKEGNTTLNMSPYKNSVSSGIYNLKVYDKNDAEIFKKSFIFNGVDVDILYCDQKWWENDGVYHLIGLSLTVQNNGDVPVYPYRLQMDYDSERITGLILPCVILPEMVEEVECFIHIEGPPVSDTFDLSLLDIDNDVLDSESFNFKIQDNIPTRSFTGGLEKKLNVPYPDFLYNYYTDFDRIKENDYSHYIFDPYDDNYLDLFIDLMINTLKFGIHSYDSKTTSEKINFAASFVQNLDYREDITEEDYPNYPLETLFYRVYGCDCEDKSILTASLLDRLGFEVALLRLENHMAVGVNLSNDQVPSYDPYVASYFFLETTTEGKPVGFVPKEYRTKPGLVVYKIDNRPFLIHDWKNGVLTIYTNTEDGDLVKIIAIVENIGSETAHDILFEGVFNTSYNVDINSESTTISILKKGMKKKVILSVSIPLDITTKFYTRIYLDGIIINDEESRYEFPPHNFRK